MDTSVKVGQPLLQFVSIGLPRHPVHSRRRGPLQAVVAAAEQIDSDVMQQGGELQLLVSLPPKPPRIYRFFCQNG